MPNAFFAPYRKISDNPNYKEGIMSFEIFKKGLDQFIQMGGSDISLTPIVGDPLIDPNLMEKIEYALKTGKIKKSTFIPTVYYCLKTIFTKIDRFGRKQHGNKYSRLR